MSENTLSFLKGCFQNEYDAYGHRFDIDKESTYDLFLKTAEHIAKIPAEHYTFYITKSKSLKFTLSLSKDEILVVNKILVPFEEITIEDVLISYFVNRDLVCSAIMPIYKIKECLS